MPFVNHGEARAFKRPTICPRSDAFANLLFADPSVIHKSIGFPVNKLYGGRGQSDLAIIHNLELITAIVLIASPVVLWKDPHVIFKITVAIKSFIGRAVKLPLLTVLLRVQRV